MIREASTAHNLPDLVPAGNGRNERRCCLVTDDRHPDDLLDEGGVDHAVRRPIAGGLDPVTAVRMATLNTAEWFGLDRRGIGAVAPGWRADLLLLDDLESVDVAAAWVGGRRVASDGSLEAEAPSSAPGLPPSVHLEPGGRQGFPVPSRDGRIRVIEMVPGQLVTGESVEEPTVEDGRAVAGLMADRPLPEVRRGLDRLHAAYEALGGTLDSPFMALSFLTLAVIPALKLTDRGLVDVESSELVDLWVSR